MILKLFNGTHIVTLLAAALLISGCHFGLRNKSTTAKEVAIYILMVFNIFQHFFKYFFWPHLWGTGFGLINTAYNVCAILIIAQPFVFVTKSSVLKQFVTCVGTIGPTLTLLVPYWFVGSDISGSWDYLRSWTCHAVLLATSLLPALWGMIKFDWRNGWKFGLVFLAMLSLILLNDTVFLLALGEATKETLYDVLVSYNPFWTMGPFGGIEQLKVIFTSLSPSFLLETGSHPYIPILWYALPMYLLVCIAGYFIVFVLDRKRMWGEPKRMINLKS